MKGVLYYELEARPLVLFCKDMMARVKELREIDELKKEELIEIIKELQLKAGELQQKEQAELMELRLTSTHQADKIKALEAKLKQKEKAMVEREKFN